ncbi:MAG: hypothetical protein EOL87_15845 [Spartobacteria bacterium]|nr:hypothetical protein [Spartobacteria bacterium]
MEGIIEALANTGTVDRAFVDIANDFIFAPLGMEGTSYVKDKPAIFNELAMPYFYGEPAPEEFVNIYGTGSMYSRPVDMAKFMRVILAGGQPLLESSTLNEMVTPQATNVPLDQFYFFTAGLGWDMAGSHPALDYAGRMCSKNGGTMAYSAMMELLLDQKLGVAVMSSSPSGIPDDAALKTLRYATLDKAGLHWPTNPVAFDTAVQSVDQSELDALAGIYVGMAGYDKVVSHPGSLTYIQSADDPEERSIISNLVMRTNGWFMADDDRANRYCFTNAVDLDLVLKQSIVDNSVLRIPLAARYTPVPVSAAWSNLLGSSWMVQNRSVVSYMDLIKMAPQIAFNMSDEVLTMTGGANSTVVLVPVDDTLAMVQGIKNRGDSAVQILDDGSILYGGYVYGAAPSNIPPTTVVTGVVEHAGFSQTYAVAPVELSPVGSFSNVFYEMTLTDAPENFLLRLYEADGVTLRAQRQGNGTLEWNASGSPLLLTVQPNVTGAQTGTYTLGFTVPVILLDISMDETNTSLIWQGPTGHTYTVESTSVLGTNDAFSPLIEGLSGTNLLQKQVLPKASDPTRFYRIIPTNSTRGNVLLISDFHLSPFVSQPVASLLNATPVENWDVLFATATNGLFTADATGYKTTSPLLLQSVLTNAYGLCPQPDAVIVPGDFPYYYLKNFYTNLVPDGTIEQGKEIILKTVEYACLKIRQTFPDAPIYFALGNNDTYLNDYDIAASGDAFYRDTADVFYQGAFTNLMPRATFTASYTNCGAYTAPFSDGQLITLQSLYFSANYPNGWEPASNQLVYLETQLQTAENAGKPAWLMLHIPPGIDPYATWSQWKSGHTNAAITDWNPDFIEPFCQLISTYSNTVKGIISGHYHNRGWQVISDPVTSNAVAPLQIADGIIYNHGNNPGATILTYDRSTLEIQHENTFCADVTKYTGSLDATIPWNLRFSQNDAFNIADLTAASLESAWEAMSDFTSPNAAFYNAAYSGGRAPYAMNATNWIVYYNGIRYTLPEQFIDAALLPQNADESSVR